MLIQLCIDVIIATPEYSLYPRLYPQLKSSFHLVFLQYIELFLLACYLMIKRRSMPICKKLPTWYQKERINTTDNTYNESKNFHPTSIKGSISKLFQILDKKRRREYIHVCRLPINKEFWPHSVYSSRNQNESFRVLKFRNNKM